MSPAGRLALAGIALLTCLVAPLLPQPVDATDHTGPAESPPAIAAQHPAAAPASLGNGAPGAAALSSLARSDAPGRAQPPSPATASARRATAWQRLPRTDVPLDRLLGVREPRALYLFRHVRLNPADRRIPAPQRDELDFYVRRLSARLRDADAREQRALREGIARLDSRRRRPVAPHPALGRMMGTPARITARAPGAGVGDQPARIRVSRRLQTAYCADGDTIVRVPLSQLPEAREAGRLRAALHRELTLGVVSFFQSRQLLSAAEAARLRQELLPDR